jgi:hypothetical protein
VSAGTTSGLSGRLWALLAVVAVVAFAAGAGAVALLSGGDSDEGTTSSSSASPSTGRAVVVRTAETVRITGPNGESVEVEARIDTGAKGSSMDDDIAEELGFDLANAETVRVTSSLGTEKRPVVEAQVLIAGREKDVRLSVTDREERDYPVLIGRRDLAGAFVLVEQED